MGALIGAGTGVRPVGGRQERAGEEAGNGTVRGPRASDEVELRTSGGV